ncbi:hypothetical protein TrVE_jg11108 [Triparma verrucosa]|uniref:Rhodanese domain-containing protein n=1 Tax=Triparma verrucosa TaxID=1606542 RepID=A0A9W7DP00_9STRA|nr:hypothetical protein TrVE_jg11108 [Triparma verrucosa]
MSGSDEEKKVKKLKKEKKEKKEKKAKKEKKEKKEKKAKKEKRSSPDDSAPLESSKKLKPSDPSPSSPSQVCTLLLFYQYISPLWSPSFHKQVLTHITETGKLHNLGGRMRCAREGLNCTLTGPKTGVLSWIESLKTVDPIFNNTDFKLTHSLPSGQNFPKLNCFKVDEIVNYGLAGSRAPDIDNTAVHLDPKEYADKMKEKDTVIIDVRNYYESQIGSFSPPKGGAVLIDPKMRKSTEFPAWLDLDSTKKKIEGKQVLMYCTGGVRCERAGALLREKVEEEGLGVKGVFQLKGGIHKYIEEFPEGGFWKGKNYTFDKRFAHAGVKLEEEGKVEVLGRCECCGVEWDRFRGKRRCPTCGVPSLICKDCNDRDERGERKLGKDVRCKLCVEEGVHSKQEWKRREEELMGGYEEKLKAKERLKKKNGKAPEGSDPAAENATSSSSSSSNNPQSNPNNVAVSVTANVTTPAPNPTNETRLWIGNLNNKKVTPSNLPTILPNVKFVQWTYGPDGVSFKGFCFVEMKTSEDAARVKAGEGTKVFGREVKVNYQKKDGKSSWPPPNAIYY